MCLNTVCSLPLPIRLIDGKAPVIYPPRRRSRGLPPHRPVNPCHLPPPLLWQILGLWCLHLHLWLSIGLTRIILIRQLFLGAPAGWRFLVHLPWAPFHHHLSPPPRDHHRKVRHWQGYLRLFIQSPCLRSNLRPWRLFYHHRRSPLLQEAAPKEQQLSSHLRVTASNARR